MHGDWLPKGLDCRISSADGSVKAMVKAVVMDALAEGN